MIFDNPNCLIVIFAMESDRIVARAENAMNETDLRYRAFILRAICTVAFWICAIDQGEVEDVDSKCDFELIDYWYSIKCLVNSRPWGWGILNFSFEISYDLIHFYL